MGHGIAAIEVKRQRGVMVVNGLGRTPRGQKYIKKSIPIEDTKGDTKKLKAEIARAVKELMPEEGSSG